MTVLARWPVALSRPHSRDAGTRRRGGPRTVFMRSGRRPPVRRRQTPSPCTLRSGRRGAHRLRCVPAARGSRASLPAIAPLPLLPARRLDDWPDDPDRVLAGPDIRRLARPDRSWGPGLDVLRLLVLSPTVNAHYAASAGAKPGGGGGLRGPTARVQGWRARSMCARSRMHVPVPLDSLAREVLGRRGL